MLRVYIRTHGMRFLRFINKYKIEVIFTLLIIAFFFMYFVVYLTPSKQAWYVEIYNQFDYINYEIIRLINKI